ncbi:MAG: DUF2007 domain-containing protein [Lentisphaerae bacterium]|nr:DUF2007 domain-containing protein [Lentisphaerota bacterium]
MLTIATYRNLMAAELARTRLEFYDIQATIADACSYTLGYGSVVDGVRLQVPAADADRAKEILATGEFVAPPDDGAGLEESPETDAISAGAFRESAADLSSNRPGGWTASLLFLSGLLLLILGRPAGAWRAMASWSGPLMLLGALLISAGLWIAYGRLSDGREEDVFRC